MADAGRSRSQRRREDFDSLFEGDPKKKQKLADFSKKADAVNKARAEKRRAAAAKRKEKMEKITADAAKRKEKSRTSFPLLGATKQQTKPTKPKPTKPKTTGVGGNLASQRDVRPFNVGVSKGGVPFKEAFKHFKNKGQKEFTWNGKKYSTATAKPKKGTTTNAKSTTGKDAPKRRKGIIGGIKTVLLGKDQKFGGDRGVIDFLPGKSRKKKPVKKAGGGMMKTKGMSKGGAMKTKGMSKGGAMKKKGMAMGGAMKKKGMAMGGAMKKKGMAMGGAMKKKGMSKGGAAKKFPDLTGDGKVTQADILKGRGVTKKKGGGMAKKGYAKGGMAKKGYAKGGPVRSKMSAKGGKRGGASRKPRGVGAAKRGFGKAMR